MDIGEINISLGVPEARSDETGRFINAVETGVAAAVREIADVARNSLIEFFGHHMESGETYSSIRVIGAGAATVLVSVGGKAIFFETGTRPHPIGTLKEALSNRAKGFFVRNPFFDEGGAVYVDHPGQRRQGPVAASRAKADAAADELLRRNLP